MSDGSGSPLGEIGGAAEREHLEELAGEIREAHRADAAAGRPTSRGLSQSLVGWGLLLEAALWVAYDIWAAVLWSMGRILYVLGPVMWLAAAIPVVIAALGILGRLRRGPLITVCLVLTLMLNLALSLSSFLYGIGMDPSMAASSRVLFLLTFAASAVLAAGIVSALRSRS